MSVTVKKTKQTQTEGDTVTFTCQATGEPIPNNITWSFNGNPIKKSEKDYQISSKPLNYTSSDNTLTVINVQSSDVGTYTCYASNGISTDTSSGVLSVNGMCSTIVKY